VPRSLGSEDRGCACPHQDLESTAREVREGDADEIGELRTSEEGGMSKLNWAAKACGTLDCAPFAHHAPRALFHHNNASPAALCATARFLTPCEIRAGHPNSIAQE
jgi:hypothetical protein